VLRTLCEHSDPAVRFLALTELAGCSSEAPPAREAHAAVVDSPAVRAILAAQYPAGYWVSPGLGISPHYRATVWQVLFLAQLGVGAIPHVTQAVECVLTANLDAEGAFHVQRGPSGRSLALTGALLWALARLGFKGDSRLDVCWHWLAAEIPYAKHSPAALWLLRAALLWERPAVVRWAVDIVWALLADRETLPPALMFPLVLQGDRLSAFHALVEAGQTLPPWALDWLAAKRKLDGFWPLEAIPGRLWWVPGQIGLSNPWVTLRALKVLQIT